MLILMLVLVSAKIMCVKIMLVFFSLWLLTFSQRCNGLTIAWFGACLV